MTRFLSFFSICLIINIGTSYADQSPSDGTCLAVSNYATTNLAAYANEILETGNAVGWQELDQASKTYKKVADYFIATASQWIEDEQIKTDYVQALTYLSEAKPNVAKESQKDDSRLIDTLFSCKENAETRMKEDERKREGIKPPF
jgi:1,4-alpha-glucan branching enzyme